MHGAPINKCYNYMIWKVCTKSTLILWSIHYTMELLNRCTCRGAREHCCKSILLWSKAMGSMSLWVVYAFIEFKATGQLFATRNICIMNSTRVIMWKLIFLFDVEMLDQFSLFFCISYFALTFQKSQQKKHI